MPLNWRLTLGIACIEIVLLATLVLGMVGFVRDTSLEGLKREARVTSELFSASATNAILGQDLATLEAMTDKVVSLPNIVFAYVSDANGLRLAGTAQEDTARLLQSGSAEQFLLNKTGISHEGLEVGEFVAAFNLSYHHQTLFSAYRWGISFGLAELIFVTLATLAFTCVLLREFKRIRESSTQLVSGQYDTEILSTTRIPELRSISGTLDTLRQTIKAQFAQLNELNADLTQEMKQKECALEAEQQLAERNSEVFAVLSHEVRTPIAAAVMLLKDSEYRQNRAVILENLTHALDLVNNLNTKVNSTANPGLSRAVVLSDAIQELNIGLQSLFVGSKSKFSPAFLVEWDGEVHLPVRYISQIVRNLVKNAILHSGAKNISFNVRSNWISDERVELNFEVKDDGIGIPPASLERIFEPYVRLDQQTPGTGLGLSVCKDLAESMGGSLEVQSSRDGSSFTLQLIAVTINPEHASAKELDSEPKTEPAPDPVEVLAGKHILVVEDNLTIRVLTEKILQKTGARVTVAEDGLDAISKFTDEIDLVLSDIHMPSMNGIELTQELRGRYPKLPIIGVTAATIGEEQQAIVDAGANACIGKPFDLRNMLELLTELETTPQKV